MNKLSLAVTLGTVLLIAAGALADDDQLQLDNDEQKLRNAIEALFVVIDVDHDSKILIAELAEAVGDDLSRNGIDPRRSKRLAAYDRDHDGLVDRAEFWEGRQALMKRQIDRMMRTDVNSDGQLTLREFSLGFPDPKGKFNDDGFTTRQVLYFKSSDLNKDGVVSEPEVRQRMMQQGVQYYSALGLTHRMLALDADGDRAIELQEFAHLLDPSGEPSKEIKTAFASYGPKDGKLTYGPLYRSLIQMTPEKRSAVELQVATHEVRKQLGEATKSLFAVTDSNRDGQADFDEVADLYGGGEIAEAQIQLVVALDADGDRKLTEEEFFHGLQGYTQARFVDRTMALDGDGDGVLSMKEYSLSYPDPDSQVDESGFTPGQVASFKHHDMNADGKLRREEMSVVSSRFVVQSVRSTVIMARAFQFDENDDDVLDLEELTACFAGPAELITAAELESRYRDWSHTHDNEAGITRHELEESLMTLDADVLRKFELLISKNSETESSQGAE